MGKNERTLRYDFRGAALNNEFAVESTGAGSVSIVNGSVAMALGAADAANVQGISQGNNGPLPADKLNSVEFLVRRSGAIESPSGVTTLIGLCDTRDDDVANIANGLFFKVVGDVIFAESVTPGVEKRDVPTGITLTTEWTRLAIELASGVTTMPPPDKSLGRGSNVHFFGGNGFGGMRRVGENTRFDVTAFTGYWQLFAQIQKASGTEAPAPGDFGNIGCCRLTPTNA